MLLNDREMENMRKNTQNDGKVVQNKENDGVWSILETASSSRELSYNFFLSCCCSSFNDHFYRHPRVIGTFSTEITVDCIVIKKNIEETNEIDVSTTISANFHHHKIRQKVCCSSGQGGIRWRWKLAFIRTSHSDESKPDTILHGQHWQRHGSRYYRKSEIFMLPPRLGMYRILLTRAQLNVGLHVLSLPSAYLKHVLRANGK